MEETAEFVQRSTKGATRLVTWVWDIHRGYQESLFFDAADPPGYWLRREQDNEAQPDLEFEREEDALWWLGYRLLSTVVGSGRINFILDFKSFMDFMKKKNA